MRKTRKNPYRNHAKNPANQPFNIKGNHTGKKGWWTKPLKKASPR